MGTGRNLLLLLTVLLLTAGYLSCSSNTQSPEEAPGAADKLPEHPVHTDHSTFFQTAFPVSASRQ